MKNVFVLSAVRTPIGKYGGGLASVPACDLAAKVVRVQVVQVYETSGADTVAITEIEFFGQG